MSYGIHPFAVSLLQLERVLRGPSKPRGFLGRLFRIDRNDLVEEIKNTQGPLDDDLDEIDGMTVEQALLDICSGAELDESCGDVYAYALEALCFHFGEFLDNSEWCQMRGESGDRVNEGMKQAGISEETISVHRHLMYRGAPLNIPDPDDFPSMGYLRSAEIAPAAKALSVSDLSAADRDIQAAVAQVRGWLDRAQVLNSDLVFFYH